jgi:uncharacterized repeat protein (TIGR03803 family)
LVLGSNTLYGTTIFGGPLGAGVVFAVNTDGTDFRVVDGLGNAVGYDPVALLVLDGGLLYGTTYAGGTNGGGTVFSMQTDGSNVLVVHSFGGDDGAAPYNGVAIASNRIYGTTSSGGPGGVLFGNGTVYAVNTDGTGFKVLHQFTGGPDGRFPTDTPVVCGSTLYGTATGGGAGSGTVFAVNADGTAFTILYTFTNGADGSEPWGSLVESGNTLYGTTALAGSNGSGTIYALTLPSEPAIDTNSMSVVGGLLQIVVTGVTPGATIYVQACSNLSRATTWLPIATNVTSGANLAITGLSVTNAAYRFFRVVETLPP